MILNNPRCPAFGACDLVELVVDFGEDVGQVFASRACLPPRLVRVSRRGCAPGELVRRGPGASWHCSQSLFVHAVGAVGAHAVADRYLAFGELVLELSLHSVSLTLR